MYVHDTNEIYIYAVKKTLDWYNLPIFIPIFRKYVVWKFYDSSSFDQLLFQIYENNNFNILETEMVLLIFTIL